jgi:hypothetical protein
LTLLQCPVPLTNSSLGRHSSVQKKQNLVVDSSKSLYSSYRSLIKGFLTVCGLVIKLVDND